MILMINILMIKCKSHLVFQNQDFQMGKTKFVKVDSISKFKKSLKPQKIEITRDDLLKQNKEDKPDFNGIIFPSSSNKIDYKKLVNINVPKKMESKQVDFIQDVLEIISRTKSIITNKFEKFDEIDPELEVVENDLKYGGMFRKILKSDETRKKEKEEFFQMLKEAKILINVGSLSSHDIRGEDNEGLYKIFSEAFPSDQDLPKYILTGYLLGRIWESYASIKYIVYSFDNFESDYKEYENDWKEIRKITSKPDIDLESHLKYYDPYTLEYKTQLENDDYIGSSLNFYYGKLFKYQLIKTLELNREKKMENTNSYLKSGKKIQHKDPELVEMIESLAQTYFDKFEFLIQIGFINKFHCLSFSFMKKMLTYNHFLYNETSNESAIAYYTFIESDKELKTCKFWNSEKVEKLKIQFLQKIKDSQSEKDIKAIEKLENNNTIKHVNKEEKEDEIDIKDIPFYYKKK